MLYEVITDVVVFDRFVFGEAALQGALNGRACAVHTGDMRRLDLALLDGVDAVIHLAGEPVAGRWTAAKRDAIRRSRVEGTRALVDALAQAPEPPRVLLSA